MPLKHSSEMSSRQLHRQLWNPKEEGLDPNID